MIVHASDVNSAQLKAMSGLQCEKHGLKCQILQTQFSIAYQKHVF